MATYDWPRDWCPNRFELTVQPNVLVFVGQYVPTVQTIDLMGERWMISLDLPPSTDEVKGRAKEAFFDRLRGPVHRIRMGNLKNPRPSGTQQGPLSVNVVNGALLPVNVVNASLQPVTVVGGSAIVASPIAAGASTASVQGRAGRTYRAGDTIGLGGQLVRILTDATFDVNGLATIEFAPRMRAAVPQASVIAYDYPTAVFMVQSEKVPVTWMPGRHETISLELVETY